ncbi:MAG: putative PEP-binding protein [Bryobacterales bacterium]|nr:putative PEP-binding protein [Bryobacterales bacterium]
MPSRASSPSSWCGWAEPRSGFNVRTNAETPRDAKKAREFGAEGIGLCRTEHMFFEEGRVEHVQAMILADDEKSRRKALAKLLPMQRKDFEQLFNTMAGYPVVIRTLDPPLHEFSSQARAVNGGPRPDCPTPISKKSVKWPRPTASK